MRISDWSSDVCSSDLLFLLLDETGGDYGRAAGAAESSASIPALLGTLTLGLALTDRDGRFRFMNQAFCRAASIGEGEEVLYPSDLVMEDEKAMVADAIRKMATGDRKSSRLHSSQ